MNLPFRQTMMLATLFLTASFFFAARVRAAVATYFAIEVVDDQTGRGVPLVELETVNNRRYFTDSAGLVAFNEPGLMDQKVFFTVTSHGYEYPADGFGYHGLPLVTTSGGHATVKIKRLNIAERLYRITGQGIYRDSVLLGRKPPLAHPLLDAGVLGQDTVFASVYRGKIYWFWGDTNRAAYPLGNFFTTAATSLLPENGGLKPSVGVNLDYIADGDFVKKMIELPGPHPVWIDGVMVLKDEDGQEKLIAHYVQVKDLETRLSQGLIVFNDQKQQFDVVQKIDLDAPIVPSGHPFPAKVDGVDYIYFPVPYPNIRVKADFKDVMDLSTYESFTPLAPGTRYDKGNTKLDRDAGGKLNWSWKKQTPPIDTKQQKELIAAGVMKSEESPFRLQNIDDGKPVQLHGGSVYWNEYRKRYVMIGLEGNGTSVLGEIWFAQAKSPEGPWTQAKKIVTHDRQDFYNPTQHPFFDEEDGRYIYFEGTFTNSFSGNPYKVPGYEYNQIMYRLDLSDPRLKLAE